ncbi:AEC family transporter [Aliarcobacter butzleri]|uniref:AEC family transporter n=1 Tax=Aliarcobacter butzleri TaxID=28197 RepID=UPI0021B18C02|nr:AEC family transporter [Aliarcobacter butzleri]MCT7616848.1 AEC family transporter [Aliarcobacter butzleri]
MITTVLPIFLVILVGFVFAKNNKFSSEAEQLINSYVLNIALPALLFLAVARADIEELTKWDFLITTLVGIFTAYILGLLFAIGIKVKSPQASLIAMGSCYGTTGYMGIPLVIVVFGTVSAVPSAIATILHNIPAIMAVIITYGMINQNNEKKGTIFNVIKNAFFITLKNPLTISVLAGIFFVLFSIKLPKVLITFSEFLGYAAGPTALFALGLGLAKLKISEHLQIYKILKVLPVVFIKIIIQPFVTFVVGYYLLNMSIDDIYFKIAIVMSALPIGAGVYVFANKYEFYKEESSIAIILSLIVTLLTLPYLLDIIN